jgi:hypothetical protein
MVATPRPAHRTWAERRRLVASLSAVSLLVVVGACRPLPEASPPPDASSAGGSVACAETGTSTEAQSAWVEGTDGAAGLVGVIVSSQISTGPSRLLYTLTTPGYEVVASSALPTEVRLFALDRDTDAPTLEAPGVFLDTGTGRGVYRSSVEFPCHGNWGAEIVATSTDGEVTRTRTLFRVREAGTTPAIGAPAPRSDSPTAETLDEVRLISTDPSPDPAAFTSTIGEVVSSGQPSVVFFATPAFCQSGVCGPTVDMVKRVMADYRGDIGFVNVEPYRLRLGPSGLEPELDENGRLQPVQSAVDYGLVVEPYLFVVDAEGNVAAKFEVVVDEQELRGALEDVLTTVAVAR